MASDKHRNVRSTNQGFAGKALLTSAVLGAIVAAGAWLFLSNQAGAPTSTPAPTAAVPAAPPAPPSPPAEPATATATATPPGDDIKGARAWAKANCPDGTILAMQTLDTEVQWMCADQSDRRHGPFISWRSGVPTPGQPIRPASRGFYRRGSPIGWKRTWNVDGSFDTATCTTTGAIVRDEASATTESCPLLVSPTFGRAVPGAWCHAMTDQLLLSCHEQEAECQADVNTIPVDQRALHRCLARPSLIHCFDYIRKTALETNCYNTADACQQAWTALTPGDLIQKSPACAPIDFVLAPAPRTAPGLECKLTLAKDLALPKRSNEVASRLVRMELKCPALAKQAAVRGYFSGEFVFDSGVHNRLSVSLCYGPAALHTAACTPISGINHVDSGDTVERSTTVTLEADFATGRVGYLLIGEMSNPSALKKGASLRFVANPAPASK